ncbi:MAG: glucosamine-6-phosphate deaminase [Eubacteriales bacterium]|nr:glucosamine-6-phosphate deaminase [Christensenellaceae bacterium]MCI7769176.1 glucosamine-6-phosphate deaminase [Christensenellaceae bacterium]MDY4709415.1 glucosamine-6-phosphate deaminase [Eubacteriales bacterium]MDY6077787.1 glucosamine-6-phosphate deaminase [Eubacteriales bacterium]
MKIIIVNDTDEFGKAAFEPIRELLSTKNDAVLGLATGSTPLPLYREMIKDREERGTSYKNVTTCNLDEYVGLPASHPESYVNFMTRNLFSKIDIDMKNVNIPNGLAPDVSAECARYSAVLEKITPDIQVLGIGANGHIAFNEPGTSFSSKTHQVFLTAKTIADNSRFFNSPDEVPRSAITMGISEIMRAKKILMLATGSNKADAVFRMIKGEVTEACPASVLQLHKNVTVILDKEAAAKL